MNPARLKIGLFLERVGVGASSLTGCPLSVSRHRICPHLPRGWELGDPSQPGCPWWAIVCFPQACRLCSGVHVGKGCISSSSVALP